MAGYLKKSKNAIEMADGDAGSALMFIKGAEQNFADIEKLTDDLITHSSDSKDREIARAGMQAGSAAVDADDHRCWWWLSPASSFHS